MNFIIAGGVLLAMFLVGTSSYLAVPYIERNIIEEQEELQMKYNTPLVISCDAVFSKEHKKQWIFVLILSIFCAIVQNG